MMVNLEIGENLKYWDGDVSPSLVFHRAVEEMMGDD
jgi:hypothetical protein